MGQPDLPVARRRHRVGSEGDEASDGGIRRSMDEHTDTTLSKANFDDIYDRPDPRAYYRQLSAFDYQVPRHGQRVFRDVLNALSTDDATVMDLCCSYGVNAALLKHDLDLGDLSDHYRDEQLSALSRDDLAAVDRAFYAERRRPDAPKVVGLDAAAPAVDYALDVGLLDTGSAEDLEHDEPSPQLARAVADVDLITVTGGIGYITERTFARVLDCIPPDRQPWVAALCLRTVSYAPVATELHRRGLVTEQLEGRTFPQRRFVDEEERAYALRTLAARGLDPTGRESEGAYHVSVYLSRPAADVARRSIDAVLTSLT